jgi:polar amino acid transport system substrate-binding protein
MRHLVVLAAAIGLFALNAPAHALSLLTEENAPLNFTHQGKLIGLSPDVVSEMAKRAGLSPEIRVLPWKDAFERARSEAGACVFSTVRNTERFKQFEWIGPIARGYWSAFAIESAQIKIGHMDDLKRYRVGVVNDARSAYLKQRGLERLVLFDRDADIPARLTSDPNLAGGVDLWVTQGYLAQRLAWRAGVRYLREVFPSLMSQDYFLACSLTTPPAELRALSDALEQMRKDGSLRRISNEAVEAVKSLR